MSNVKDVSEEEIQDWMKAGRKPVFLQDLGSGPLTPLRSVALTSYPRSGNTMVRKMLERLTGVYTGSDCDLQ